MRVIAGSARGTRLQAPKGRTTRPTQDRVREALFSILAPEIEDACFLDLFAGSGANGIEALSRGAAFCDFVDVDKDAVKIIEQNLEAVRMTDRARVRRIDAPGDLGSLESEAKPYSLIFADPPYDFDDYQALLEAIDAHGLLGSGGLLIIEHSTRGALADFSERWNLESERRYGDTVLSFFRNAGP